ncbi:glycosyltransferase family 4 protein [Aquiflexum lacus]|uniref:glycosyltransferase family 4 protein n=1 Tax=Aquiflexum lacus TaxID=2483805 RepID=UPI0018948DF1|nr:glycosyltransferase family 4 protein [Aquiflexum lacus]
MASILMLHGSSDLYGASKIFLKSVTALKAAGHEVYIVLSEDGPLIKGLEGSGAVVFLHKLGILRRKYFNPSGLINRAKTIRKANVFLENLIKEKKITHVYSNTAAVLVGALAAKNTGTKHIWHLHEILVSPKWFVLLMGKMINRYADQVVVVSQAVWDSWKVWIDASKMVLLYNGIDYDPYLQDSPNILHEIPSGEDKVIIGMIGRVSHWKGQLYFLDIAQNLLEKHQNIHFLIVGDAYPGTDHFVTEMLAKIKTLALEKEVTYLGYREDIPEILRSLDIFVLPSILPDPLPTVILEAMASAKPVVATAHGGACEMLLDEETGFLMNWDNAAKAATLIEKLILDKSRRLEMGIKGKKRVLEKFSPEAYQSNFVRIFEND